METVGTADTALFDIAIVFMYLALLGLVIGGVAGLVLWLMQGRLPAQRGDSGPSAVEILKRRYARGEITREEYEQMRHELTEE